MGQAAAGAPVPAAHAARAPRHAAHASTHPCSGRGWSCGRGPWPATPSPACGRPQPAPSPRSTAPLTQPLFAQVVNIEAVRNYLAKHPDAAVKSVAAGSTDAALHQAVTASGEVRGGAGGRRAPAPVRPASGVGGGEACRCGASLRPNASPQAVPQREAARAGASPHRACCACLLVPSATGCTRPIPCLPSPYPFALTGHAPAQELLCHQAGHLNAGPTAVRGTPHAAPPCSTGCMRRAVRHASSSAFVCPRARCQQRRPGPYPRMLSGPSWYDAAGPLPPACSDVVIDLLKDKEQLRRSDIVEAAKLKVGE